MAKGRTKKKGNKICSAGIAWAKRTFDTSYLKANKLEELPDREEASYKAYL